MGWNHKTESAGWLFLFAIPIIAMIVAIIGGTLFPFIHNHPILFWVMVVVLFVIGFIFVCRRTGKKR